MSKATVVIAAAFFVFVAGAVYPAVREAANVLHTVTATLHVAADKAN